MLPDSMLEAQLTMQLGDASKSLHDEMRKIDSMTVTTFGNLHLEVSCYPESELISVQRLGWSADVASTT